MPWIACGEGNTGLDNPLGRTEHFYMLVRAHLYIPEASDYEFRLRRADGSRLLVDGVEVVENGGTHAMRDR